LNEIFYLEFFRLEEEEQNRQKLQIERVQLEAKIKHLEDIVASQQNDLAKVKKIDFDCFLKYALI
jgi:hypothetical protein